MTTLCNIQKMDFTAKDERGSTYNFSTKPSVNYLLINRNKGSTSGCHYHLGKWKVKDPEVILLISGKIKLYMRHMETGKEETIDTEAPAKIEMPPMVYHEVHALTDIIMIEPADEKLTPEKYNADTRWPNKKTG